MKHLIPGITAVGWVRCSNLHPNLQFMAMAGVPVPEPSGVVWLDILGEGSCKEVATPENHGESRTATLTFDSREEVPAARGVAFVFAAASGEKYLLGSAEQPYPIAEVDWSSGNESGEKRAWSAKITAKGLRPLILLAQ